MLYSEPIIFIEKVLGIEQLKSGIYQPRKYFDKSYINKLADSIKLDGIIEPLIVRPTANKNIYEIVAGECRWRAAQIAGLSTVSCRIGDYTNEQACRIALIENTTRLNLNPIEEAEGIARLVEEFSYTHLQVSQTLGIPRSEVSNTLRLLRLEDSIKEMLRVGQLSEAHGKILAGMKNTKNRVTLAMECVNKQWSTRDLDKVIKGLEQKINENNSQGTNQKKDLHTIQLERNLSDYFGYPIQINLEKDNSGSLNIRFYDMDGLQSILHRSGFMSTKVESSAEEY